MEQELNELQPLETPDVPNVETPDYPSVAQQADSTPDGEVTGHTPDDSDRNHFLPFYIVAIGASAGGVEAYFELFSSLPGNTGMAFVVIPHLSATHESHLAQLLRSRTPMQVNSIEEGQQPQPDQVYVLPSNRWARMDRGKFVLEPRPATRLPHPINHFFRSLAADQKSRAIGVVLSGTDSDGALGLLHIKREGGISIVQTPESAQYADMPRASISEEHVDLILAPAQIGQELARLAIRLQQQDQTRGVYSSQDEADFHRILAMLRTVSGVHFRQYKPFTLRRRINRRMLLERIQDLGAYSRFLQANPTKLRELQEDVLIGVTQFFRDPDVFESLESDVFPHFFAGREPNQQIRIWVAGCSTGQEVYSLAICLLEFMSERSLDAPIQIFGTDASEASIVKARLGVFSETMTADVSPERLRRFFTKVDKGHQVNKRVRDICIFARQNLCVDPPFSRLDLISCRNVLIYFGAELQKHVIPTFHYALRPNGFLLLGLSESIRGFQHLFGQIERRTKLFLRTDEPSRLPLTSLPQLAQLIQDRLPDPSSRSQLTDMEVQRAADRIVMARYSPPGVIINERAEILQYRGHTRAFLEMPPGTITLQIYRMVPDNIVAPLRDAVERAIQLDIPIRLDRLSTVSGQGTPYQLTIEVLPIPNVTSRTKCLLILFIPQEEDKMPIPETGRIAIEASADEKDAQLARLRQDLQVNKQYLQSLLEDRDAKNQELISANEEIQSANEELQSTNEELETTKEELQSANEELQTVNDELRERNTTLMLASNDLTNLLNSVNMPVLMVSMDLRIRHFTPPTQRLINLRSTDIGRPLKDIRMNLSVENLDVVFAEVLDTLAPREMVVQDQEGGSHLLRIRPYRTTENKIDGLVLVFVDITEQRRVEQELTVARDFGRSIIENVPLPVVVLNLDFRIQSVNDALRKMLDPTYLELTEGRSFLNLADTQWGMRQLSAHLERLKDGPDEAGRFEFEHKVPGKEQYFFVVGCRLRADHQRLLFVTVQDVSARIHAQAQLENERARLTLEVQATAEKLGVTQEELRAFAGQLMNSQEEERRRIARELHDDVSQKLAVLANDSAMLENRLIAQPEELRLAVERFSETIGNVTETVRTISHRLHPSILEDLGLAVALNSLVEDFGERYDMPATFHRQQLPGAIPLPVATTMYRIAQEALRNVTKYAGRTHVKVTLDSAGTDLRLEIADFGLGFDMASKRSGLGLLSMEERAKLVSGVLSIQSSPGNGTRITLCVPMQQEAERST